ncbi:MAG: caspase family protein [Steroidobacteraceae bacterium]
MKRRRPCARFRRVHHSNTFADITTLPARVPQRTARQGLFQTRILAAAALLVLLIGGQAGTSAATSASGALPLSPSGTRRAVLVGIDHYRFATDAEIEAARPQLLAAHMLEAGKEPPARDWHALDGAVNDERAMHELLVHRYEFDNSHITELANEAATRSHILAALEQNFVTDARDGDVLFFFYSGHGSQMRNSRSMSKGDKVDETIVPWDANAGYFDIRDKELARIFNAALTAHHVTLTAIFDSCHSGSIARGLIHHKSKSEPEDTRDAADAYNERPPEERGALILSAAQFDEEALESEDDRQQPALPRGAFALSLMQAMDNSDPATPAIELFRAARSRLHTLGSDYSQEPVISGSVERQRLGLFGDAPTKSFRTRAQLIGIDADSGELTLDAGLAIGLAAGAEFRSARDPSTYLRVTEVQGLSQSRAQLIAGSAANLKLNDEFLMTQWSVPGSAPLSVWIPQGSLPLAKLAELARALSPLMHGNFHWVIDPSLEAPTQWLRWSGRQWLLSSTAGELDVTGSATLPDIAKIGAALRSEDHLLVLMPPPTEWQSALQADSGAVTSVADRTQATYWLTGTLKGSSIAYAWVQPDAARAVAAALTLPARTDWIDSAEAQGGAHLHTFAERLGTVATLLRLPESGVSDPFPYHLVLRREGSPRDISGTDLAAPASLGNTDARALKSAQVSGGELYDLVLKSDVASLADFNDGHPNGRWVYVFVVDSSGHRDPLFVHTDQRARFPRDYPPALDDPEHVTCKGGNYPAAPPLDEVCVGTIRVCPDYGVDTYFLLSSSQQIPDISVFSGEGVHSAALTRGPGSALAVLLGAPGAQTRGATPVPEQFSIERLTVISAGREDLPECKD